MSLISEVKQSIAAGMSGALGLEVAGKQIRVPSRNAAASSSALIGAGMDAAQAAERLNAALDVFPRIGEGVRPVSSVRSSNGWLLFDLTEEFYRLAAEPAAIAPGGGICPESYCFYRMKMLARYPSRGCPDNSYVQRALLLCWCAYETGTEYARRRAEEALLTMAYALPAVKRQQLLRECGDIGRTAVRLLYTKNKPTGRKP